MRIVWTYKVFVDSKTHITTWRETYRHLKDLHNVTYIFPCANDSATGLGPNDVLIKKSPIPGIAPLYYAIRTWNALKKLNREFKPEIVVLDFWTFHLSFQYFFKKKRPLVFLDFRDPKHNTEGKWLRNAYSWFLSKIYINLNTRFHDGVMFISDGLREQLAKEFGRVHPNNLSWPSGVDVDTFKPIKTADRNPNAPLQLFFHGSVTHHRGLSETIMAIGLLKKRNIPVQFTIVGEGWYLATIKKLVVQLALSDEVIFKETEPYEKMPQYIAEADICAMAYPKGDFWEGNVPLKLLEYMAMEKVVMCTDMKVFRNITENSSCALFAQDCQADLIAETLAFASANKHLLHEWGRAGREIVMRRFTWEAITNNIHHFLVDTLNQHTKHREHGV